MLIFVLYGQTNEEKMQYSRKEAAELLGIGKETLRFYEKKGLISQPARTSSGHRLYSDTDTQKIVHVLKLKELGFTLNEIKEFLNINNPTSNQMTEIILKKIKQIQLQIQQLQNQKMKLETYLAKFNEKIT